MDSERDFEHDFYAVLAMLHQRATLADYWRARTRGGHWLNTMRLDYHPRDFEFESSFYAVLSMLERRATFVDKMLARWRRGHWLNSARRELLVVGKR